MPVNNILNRLDKVVPAGESKWRCACPVHNGKDRNMMISERTDGSVGVHCFVCGATGTELMETLGLPMKELFSPDSTYIRPTVTKKMEQELLEDELVLLMAQRADEDGTKLSLEDRRRVRLARHRASSIQAMKQET
jgi:hypothetical protein